MAEEKAEGAAKPKRGKSILIGGLFVAFVLFFFPYWYTANPKSCARCHEMKPFYTTWKQSMHSTAARNCFYCHLKPGLVNRIFYQITFYREIYSTLANHNLEPFGATAPGTSSCQRSGCHSLNRLSSQSEDIRIDHRNHVIKAKVSCPQCHRGASHPGLDKTGSKLPPRKQCKKCHKMGDCSMCHMKKVMGGFKH